MDLNAVVRSMIAANPALQGFAGFDRIAALTSFEGDVSNDRYRSMMKAAGMAPVAATQLGLQIGEVLAKLKGAAYRVNQVDAMLQLLGPAAAASSIAALETAMSQVTRAALALVDADFEKEDNGLEAVFADCETAFAKARDVAEDGLKAVSNLHAQLVEIHALKLTPLEGQISTISDLFQPDLQRSTERFRNAKAQANQEEQAARTLAESVKVLQGKIDDNRSSSQASDIAFDILTLGIGRAVNGAPPDPFGFRDQIRDLQKQLDGANQSRNKARDVATVLRFQMQQVREQLMYLEAMQGDVPTLFARLNRAKNNSVAMQEQFVVIKDRISSIVRKVGQVRSTAVNTRDLAVVQSEFTNGLLLICQQALIDPRLLDEVKAVTDIIDLRFTLADLPATTRKEINSLVATMEKQTSIAGTGPICGPLGIPLAKRSRQKLLVSVPAIDKLPLGPLGLPCVIRTSA